MTEAHTLRGLAGLDPTPCGLAESALVMIDCQNTYRAGVMALVGVEEALAEAAKLLARARDCGATIIHIAHDSGPGSPYDYSAEIGQIADTVAPRDSEPVIVKSKPNAFIGTDLHDRLQAAGRQNLILAGFMTHMCVNSTARAAFSLGYRTTVVGGPRRPGIYRPWAAGCCPRPRCKTPAWWRLPIFSRLSSMGSMIYKARFHTNLGLPQWPSREPYPSSSRTPRGAT